MVNGKLKQHLGSATRMHMTASRQSINNNFFEGSEDGFRTYHYDGKDYDVPKDWDFPVKVKQLHDKLAGPCGS
jgi:GH18 family chitinase